MVKRNLKLTLLLICFSLASTLANAQSKNLLRNPNATEGDSAWRAVGEASIEQRAGGDSCFVIRNGGSFYQDIKLPEDGAGQYAVLIGRASSERIHPGGAITDLPVLYGYMMNADERILDYLQGQKMLSSVRVRDEWTNLSGIFKVPEGTKTIRFFLNQALQRAVPHDGSAARFDSLGLHLFSTKEDAKAFVDEYH